VEDHVKKSTDERSEPLGHSIDLGAWEPELPPSDFAERVLARVQAEEEGARSSEGKEAPRARRRRWVGITGGVVALALAAAVLLRITAPPARGGAIAKERIEVAIGARALAVLEPGADVRWSGDVVVQSRGDVFYRVEPGKRFTVHTPAGDVEVMGTCFSVKVRPLDVDREGSNMVKRDVKAGAVGAALSALAFVAVYEGKVAVSRASSGVELRAGESAQMGPDGMKRLGADGEKALETSAAAAANGDDPLGAANKNLVRQVSEYRSRLEAIAAQKSELETKLKRSEERLAASQDGAPVTTKHDFDLSPDDWKDLAKDGTIKYQMPCARKQPWVPSPEKLNALGLAPQDGPAITNAYAHSNQRVWSELKPLCAQAVGSAEIADRIGLDTCIHLIFDMESERDSKATKEAQTQVAQIRAGSRPMPGPDEQVNPIMKLFLTTTGESKRFEAELAQTFGPEEAHRIVYSDELCMGSSTWGQSRAPKK
jgi:ferric-dicitrate binding protein FerR (iron transport regulator)